MKQKSFVLQNDKLLCPLCYLPHLLFKCRKYLELSVSDKLNCVRKFQLCFNCLGKHKIALCTKLNKKCKSCSLNHHSTLCNKSFSHQNTLGDKSEINSSSKQNEQQEKNDLVCNSTGASEREGGGARNYVKESFDKSVCHSF